MSRLNAPPLAGASTVPQMREYPDGFKTQVPPRS
jgi:hypothetical protein